MRKVLLGENEQFDEVMQSFSELGFRSLCDTVVGDQRTVVMVNDWGDLLCEVFDECDGDYYSRGDTFQFVALRCMKDQDAFRKACREAGVLNGYVRLPERASGSDGAVIKLDFENFYELYPYLSAPSKEVKHFNEISWCPFQDYAIPAIYSGSGVDMVKKDPAGGKPTVDCVQYAMSKTDAVNRLNRIASILMLPDVYREMTDEGKQIYGFPMKTYLTACAVYLLRADDFVSISAVKRVLTDGYRIPRRSVDSFIKAVELLIKSDNNTREYNPAASKALERIEAGIDNDFSEEDNKIAMRLLAAMGEYGASTPVDEGTAMSINKQARAAAVSQTKDDYNKFLGEWDAGDSSAKKMGAF